MIITNNLGLPEAIVAAILNDPYDGGKSDITVTKLISPPRKVALETIHAKAITEDAADLLWALMGQSIHSILERAEVEAIAEKRLSIERQGWSISGKFDRLVVKDGLLQDYKVVSVHAAKNGGKLEWGGQLNVLAQILRENGYPVRKLEAIAILRDWSKSQVSRNQDYPDKAAVKIGIPLWDECRCEEFIDERIRLHQAARIKLPLCSPHERWQRPDVFAVMKSGRKTAVRLFDNEADANAYTEMTGSGLTIIRRPGTSIRCDGYCAAAPFCDQRTES
jgi:hypothetical protein